MTEPTIADIGKQVRWYEPAPLTKRLTERQGTLERLPISDGPNRYAVVFFEHFGQRHILRVHPSELEVVEDANPLGAGG